MSRIMWLHVAEYNPNAISFYNEYGFQKTEVGASVLLVLPTPTSMAIDTINVHWR
jgi:hypothetical protein